MSDIYSVKAGISANITRRLKGNVCSDDDKEALRLIAEHMNNHCSSKKWAHGSSFEKEAYLDHIMDACRNVTEKYIKPVVKKAKKAKKAKPQAPAKPLIEASVLLNVVEISRHFKVSETTPYNWITAGCPVVDLNEGEGRRKIRFTVANVQEWIDTKKSGRGRPLNAASPAYKKRMPAKKIKKLKKIIVGKKKAKKMCSARQAAFSVDEKHDWCDYSGNPGKRGCYGVLWSHAAWLISKGLPINAVTLPGVSNFFETGIAIEHPDDHKFTLIEADSERIDVVREKFKGTNADIINSRLDDGKFKDSSFSWEDLSAGTNFVWLDLMTRFQKSTEETIKVFFANCKSDYISFGITLGQRTGGAKKDYQDQCDALVKCIEKACYTNEFTASMSFGGEYQANSGQPMVFAAWRFVKDSEIERIKQEQKGKKK
jgi:hypothetical protein